MLGVFTEVLGKALGVNCCGRHNNFEVRTL